MKAYWQPAAPRWATSNISTRTNGPTVCDNWRTIRWPSFDGIWCRTSESTSNSTLPMFAVCSTSCGRTATKSSARACANWCCAWRKSILTVSLPKWRRSTMFRPISDRCGSRWPCAAVSEAKRGRHGWPVKANSQPVWTASRARVSNGGAWRASRTWRRASFARRVIHSSSSLSGPLVTAHT